MSVNTLVKNGIIFDIKSEVKLLKVSANVGEVHYNPGLARDNNGNIFISIRSCITNYKEKYGTAHPLGYENFLHVGILDEKTLKISGLKEIKPDKDYPGIQWGIEDVRLFWREDGLHGIGAILPVELGKIKLREGEILIDYKKGTYSLIRDLGRPFGHAEKNWAPTEDVNKYFNFVYSPTQIVDKKGKIIGEDSDLIIHNGTPLIPYENGYISLGHVVIAIHGERTYAQLALKFNKNGKLIEHSQFFHFNIGWREKLKETIEFASGLLWSSGLKNKELLVGLGVKDEYTGICKIPVEKLNWIPYNDTMWYTWKWNEQPNRKEINF